MRAIDFFVIGAPRCGTTSLYHALRGHPAVFLPEDKEPRFWATDHQPTKDTPFPMAGVWDDHEYEELFQDAKPGQVRGEFSTNYLASPAASAGIAERCPNARAIIILREPAERAFSNYMQHFRDETEDAATFEEALERADERRAAGWSPYYDYIRMSRYADDVARWFDALGRERVLVIAYEQLVQDKIATLGRVQAFLHLPVKDLNVAHHNKGGTRREHSMSRRLLVSEGIAKRVARRLLPEALRMRIWLRLRNRSIQGETLCAETKARLQQLFRADIEALCIITGDDVWRQWLHD